jgi:hypothetical protein
MPSFAPAFAAPARAPQSAHRARTPQPAGRDARPYLGEAHPATDPRPADAPDAVPQADGYP